MWYAAMPEMLGILLDDTSAVSSDRYLKMLVVSGMYVQQEINLPNKYNINVLDITITPDPFDLEDYTFINFTVLKAACMHDQGVFRRKALISGLEAKAGPAVLKTLQKMDGFKELLTLGPCAAYEKLKEEYQFGDASIIWGIFSPFISETFDPSLLHTRRDERIF